MKKHIYWILPTVVLTFIIILYAFVPYVFTFWFRLRHVLVYGLTLYIILVLSYKAADKIIDRYLIKRTGSFILISLFATILILLAITLSTLQMRYIEFYEIPPLERCSYYDDYGNFLYTTQYDGACPELDNVVHETVNGEKTLSFSVTETIVGGGKIVSTIDDNIAIQEFEVLDSTLHTSVSITYFDKSYIKSVSLISYEIQQRVNSYDQSQTTYARMITRNVTNILTDDMIEVVTESGVYEETSVGHIDVTFPEVTRLDTHTFTLTSKLTPNGDYSAYLDIDKSWVEDGEEQVDTFLRGEYIYLNDPLVTLDYYEKDRATGASLNAYFDYGDISFKHVEESAFSSGVDEIVHTRYITFVDTPQVFYDISDEGEFFVFKEFSFTSSPHASHLSTEQTVDYFTADKILYAMEDTQTSKYIKTDYGYKIEDYSTRRYSNGSYYPDFQHRLTYEIINLYNYQTGKAFEDYYNYESYLRFPGMLSNYHFYQHNLLLEGHFYKK